MYINGTCQARTMELMQAFQNAEFTDTTYQRYIVDLLGVTLDKSTKTPNNTIIHQLFKNNETEFEMTWNYIDSNHSVSKACHLAISDSNSYLLFIGDLTIKYNTLSELDTELLLFVTEMGTK